MDADIIMLGRVSTEIKAGIPAHVLSILEILSNTGLKFVNVVPSLTRTYTFKTESRYINKDCIETVCDSIYVRKTLAISLPFVVRYIKLLRRNPKAVVHIHLPDPISILVTIPCTKRKIISTFHADLLGKGIFSKVYDILLKIHSLKKNNTFVVPTPDHIEGSSLKKLKGEKKVIPFIFRDENNCEIEELINDSYKSDKTKFLFVGRHVEYKGIDIAIRAFQKIPHNKECVFNIVGEGPLTKYLKGLAEQDTRIKFIGQVPDDILKKLYANSNVFVLSSTTQAEAFGLVQVEAMLNHCMCLTSQLKNGVNFVNREGVSGYSFKVGDVEALSKLMMEACVNKEERNRLMASAKDYARSNFASDNLKKKYFQLYR